MAGDTSHHSWEKLEPEFKRQWEARYRNTGITWEEIREAHQFGWVMARRPEFEGRSFDEAEDDLRSHWFRPQLTSDETAWEISRVAARAGWDRSRELARRGRRY